jgi:quercetin dioxygenase-like cupin family protein
LYKLRASFLHPKNYRHLLTKIKISMDHFIALNDLENKELMKGITLDFFHTEHLMVAFTTLKAGREIPWHHHIHEAIEFVIEGELEMQVGETNGVLKPGVISNVPSNIRHKAQAITDCKVITVFYPLREDLKK